MELRRALILITTIVWKSLGWVDLLLYVHHHTFSMQGNAEKDLFLSNMISVPFLPKGPCSFLSNLSS